MSDYKTVSAKLGNIQSATRSISKEIFDATKAAGHEIWYMWGMGSSSEHATGRALDLMVRNEAAGDWIRNYIWTNRQRLRLQHVIWEQHITSTVTSPGVRRKMADRGSVTENHYDHVHVLFFAGSYVAPGSTSPSNPASVKKSVTEIAREVITGKWGNGDDRVQKLRAAGYDPLAVQRQVNVLMGAKKSVAEVAREVVAGKWGNGDERVQKLRAAGYNPLTVQRAVNILMDSKKSTKKSVRQIAGEVIAGKWGNGDERVARLKAAGYDPKVVQAEVNRLRGHRR